MFSIGAKNTVRWAEPIRKEIPDAAANVELWNFPHTVTDTLISFGGLVSPLPHDRYIRENEVFYEITEKHD
jgi:hypothetical protein